MNIHQLQEKVTNRIVEKLTEGIIPWRKPWRAGQVNFPYNWVTKKYYSGINLMLLEPGQYATFLQVTKAGGKILKGAKATEIYFMKPVVKKKEVDGELIDEKFFIFKAHHVFNIETQTTLDPHGQDSLIQLLDEVEPIALCEEVLTKYYDKPNIYENSTGASYTPATDIIKMPKRETFSSIEEFYNTLFHELIHSTGHQTRCKRTMNTSKRSNAYALEELIAEIGAAMLSTMCNIEHKTIDNTAAYIDHWLGHLKNDKSLLYQASKLSQEAVKYMIKLDEQKNQEVAS